jgi:glycosyltransferase involved in cell wall biosynthesis
MMNLASTLPRPACPDEATATLRSGSGADSSLLLDLPVPFRRIAGCLHVEAQAHNGLARWLDNFERVTLCAPLLPDALDNPPEHQLQWLPLESLSAVQRIRAVPLPWAYDPVRHAWHKPAVRARLRALIAQHRYLCFANLGWLGSWGNVAAEQAHRAGRAYSIWLDWVLHEMPPTDPGGPLKRAYGALKLQRLKAHSLRAVRNAALGLFHGNSVHQAYAPLCRKPCLVHDVHLGSADLIPTELLAQRLQRVDGVLRIAYVGRVHPMKGPMEWIETVAALCRDRPAGVQRIEARWLGDGPLLEAARQRVQSLGLQAQIEFPGAEAERARVLSFLRHSDVFLFCHLTPESPRCLIEALMSGLPLLGFDSAYARQLVEAASDAGRFVPPADTHALSRLLRQQLDRPGQLQHRARQARHCGSEFSDVAVFRHRSQLIKAHLP